MASLLTTSLFISLCLLFMTTVPSLAQPVAPGPAGSKQYNNFTAILEAGGQFTTCIRLLIKLRLDVQLNSQLNNSYSGLTFIAPTDNAFNKLKPGLLNGLSEQEQIELMLYHVLPRFYTLVMFDTVSNPVNTQASGSEGADTLNITSYNNQITISTGVVNVTINNALSSTFPLAVYPVETVLLPYSLFGAKPPAAAPPPKPSKPENKTTAAPAPSKSYSDTTGEQKNSATNNRALQWTTSFVGLVLMSVIYGIF